MCHEAEEPDEDYLDTDYLHTAAELYENSGHAFPGMGPEMEYEYGKNFDPFGKEERCREYQGLIVP